MFSIKAITDQSLRDNPPWAAQHVRQPLPPACFVPARPAPGSSLNRSAYPDSCIGVATISALRATPWMAERQTGDKEAGTSAVNWPAPSLRGCTSRVVHGSTSSGQLSSLGVRAAACVPETTQPVGSIPRGGGCRWPWFAQRHHPALEVGAEHVVSLASVQPSASAQQPLAVVLGWISPQCQGGPQSGCQSGQSIPSLGLLRAWGGQSLTADSSLGHRMMSRPHQSEKI